MRKVRIFTATDELDLESAIAKFLADHARRHLIDVHICAANLSDNTLLFAAAVLYEDG